MDEKDVLTRANEVLADLYQEIYGEDWAQNNEEYDKHMDDFFIISNILGELMQYRYNKSMSKDEFKKKANKIIDHYLK